ESGGESLGRSASAVITGTGPCRMSTLTVTVDPGDTTSSAEASISPPITAMFPDELKVVSGNPSTFGAKLSTTLAISGTPTISCDYYASGPTKMTVTSCSGVTPFEQYSLTNLELRVFAFESFGAGSVTVQSQVSALEDNHPCTVDTCDPGTGV